MELPYSYETKHRSFLKIGVPKNNRTEGLLGNSQEMSMEVFIFEMYRQFF